MAPTPPSHAPGVALAALGTLPFGAVLGPEAPVIALGSVVGVAAARFSPAGERETRVLASAGGFAAISALFGGPLVAGIMLISQSATVTIMGSSLSRGSAAIDVQPGEAVSDPLPQALALTALVIGLATVALLLALVHRVVMVFRTAERDELAAGEAEHEADLEAERLADQEETG